MSYEHIANQQENDTDNILTLSELIEIALYTVQKINSYPKSLGKTVDNYFHLLFPDEIKAHLVKREINAISSVETKNCIHNTESSAHTLPSFAQKAREIRVLCQIYVEQQDHILRLISDKLDELEADLSEKSVGEEETDV